MNNNYIQIFQTVALRPHVLQYVINEFPAICLSIAAFWIYVFGKFMWHEYFIYAALFLVIYLFCKLLSLLRTEWRTRQTLWRAVQMLTQKLCCQTIHDCPKVVPLHYESE